MEDLTMKHRVRRTRWFVTPLVAGSSLLWGCQGSGSRPWLGSWNLNKAEVMQSLSAAGVASSDPMDLKGYVGRHMHDDFTMDFKADGRVETTGVLNGDTRVEHGHWGSSGDSVWMTEDGSSSRMRVEVRGRTLSLTDSQGHIMHLTRP